MVSLIAEDHLAPSMPWLCGSAADPSKGFSVAQLMRGARPLARGEAAAKQSQVNNDTLMGFQCLSIALETQWSGHSES